MATPSPHSAQLLNTLLARRAFLARGGIGLGAAALASLLRGDLRGEEGAGGPASLEETLLGSRGVVAPLHFAPRAKRVIVLHQAGGPSHLESFQYKQALSDQHGQPMPESITDGQPLAQLQGQELKCQAPMFEFERYGECGREMSTLFPQMGALADEFCVVNSMVTEQINHDPAHTFMNTGTQISGRPSMGSWVLYGLGAETENLPGFVVLTSVTKNGRSPQPLAARQWHSGFLPSMHQGVEFHTTGDAVSYVARPEGIAPGQQEDVVETVGRLDALRHEAVDDPEIATRIAQYELAFRMQTSVPELMDLSDEPQAVLERYGTEGSDGTYAANCLLARRLAERGVRFIQLYHRAWDHHDGLRRYMANSAREVDGPTAALIADLKERDMLRDTLIVWGGEFGRTPMGQGDGRDHHIKGFSMMLCGGGIQGGIAHGATDEFGYNAVEDIVHVHDYHATMLHLLGIDHERLTFRTQGRDFRLTDVHGQVVREILA